MDASFRWHDVEGEGVRQHVSPFRPCSGTRGAARESLMVG